MIVKYLLEGLRAIVRLLIPKGVRRDILPRLLQNPIGNYLLSRLNLFDLEKLWSSLARTRDIDIHKYLDVSFKPSFNVIIIVVDALRNSQLSCEGYFRETTPTLDKIGLKFTAVSASSWTYPSVASILTGLYPHNHGAQLHGKTKRMFEFKTLRLIRDDVLTLPEILSFLEYDIYFAAAIPLAYWSLRGRVSPRLYSFHTRAGEMLSDLVSWIRNRRKGKFFAYVQLGDVHEPLNPPKEFRNFFGRVENLPNIATFDFDTSQQRKSNARKFQNYRKNRELLYDNTLRYVDSTIGQFYQTIKDQGLRESTIIVVTSDHGEEFWEHADLEEEFFFRQRKSFGTGHGHNVFNELIRVPLIFVGPIPGKQTTDLVSTVDIVPTITNLVGIRHYMAFDGENIFSVEGARTLLTEASGMGYEKKALTTGRFKFVSSPHDGINWLFDLEKDPQEQHPIVQHELIPLFNEMLNQINRLQERRTISSIARRLSNKVDNDLK